MRKTLEKASATRVLGGAKIKTIGRRGVVFAVAAPFVAASIALMERGASHQVVALAAGAVLVFEAIALRAYLTAGTRRNNDGVEALSLGELDRAEEGFRSIVVRRLPGRWTALGLQNLSVVALRKGELDDAVALGRAALEVHARSGIRPPAATFAGHVRANFAFALLCRGEVDEAEASWAHRSSREPSRCPPRSSRALAPCAPSGAVASTTRWPSSRASGASSETSSPDTRPSSPRSWRPCRSASSAPARRDPRARSLWTRINGRSSCGSSPEPKTS
ncbi:MAG: hypothetical protein HYY06_18700 [Deltaproteobacteria bacterium]|nr:hypothetical protein [Deltaproteobacteria bacterium]